MRQTALILGLFLVGTAAFAADSQLLNLVMPDAKVLAGVNVTNAKISPFGQFLISRIPSADPRLQNFIGTTGFDPRQDVSEILVASTGDPTHPGGLLLVRGTFDVTKITAAVSSHGNQQVQTYAGATLITGTDAKHNVTHGLAFLNGTIAIAGEVSAVEAALDRNSGTNSIDATLAAQVNDLSTREDEWLASIAPVSTLIPNNAKTPTGPAAQVLQTLKSIQSFSGGVKFGDNDQVTGQAVTNDAQNAVAMGNVIKLAIALASMNSGNTGTNAQAAAGLQILQALQVTTAGADVNLALTVPESQIESLIATLHPARRGH